LHQNTHQGFFNIRSCNYIIEVEEHSCIKFIQKREVMLKHKMFSSHSTFVWDAHAGFESRPDADLQQLNQWCENGVDYLSVNVGYDVRSWQNTIKTLANYRHYITSHPERFKLVECFEDIDTAIQEGLLAVSFDIEGMESLDGEIRMVKFYYDLGVRQMLFAYNLNNRAGGGCHDQDIGLTDFGKEVIQEMNRLGMLVDCSHTSYRTSMEAIETSSDPVIFSHSNPKALCDHPRNIGDDQIRACAKKNGVVGINGVSQFLDGTTDPLRFVEHILYTADVAGAEHVGLGLDYVKPQNDLNDLVHENQRYWPSEHYARSVTFMNLEALPQVAEELFKRGMKEQEIRGIFGANFLNLAKNVWKAPRL